MALNIKAVAAGKQSNLGSLGMQYGTLTCTSLRQLDGRAHGESRLPSDVMKAPTPNKIDHKEPKAILIYFDFVYTCIFLFCLIVDIFTTRQSESFCMTLWRCNWTKLQAIAQVIKESYENTAIQMYWNVKLPEYTMFMMMQKYQPLILLHLFLGNIRKLDVIVRWLVFS